MTTYYLDTSALIKRYVQETGTDWIKSLMAPDASNMLLTSRVTIVEVYSAIARRKREGSVPVADCIIAAQAFAVHCATDYEFAELNEAVIHLARALLDRHPLRAYDAVQLASAIRSNQVLLDEGLPSLVFLSADNRLISVAMAESLSTDNPSLHP